MGRLRRTGGGSARRRRERERERDMECGIGDVAGVDVDGGC